MSDKPVIFISYSHLDEPERTPEGDIAWLKEIQSYVAPAVKGTFELWTDEDIDGGGDWEAAIKAKLANCNICILLISRHSLASAYVVDVEVAAINERIAKGEAVQIYPIVLSPFPEAAAPASLLALNLRPRLDKPLSGFSRHDRGVEISKIADEIVRRLGGRKPAMAKKSDLPKPAYVHTTGLPETAYERLVGRDAELKRLDEAWVDNKTSILSLVAEGGAGKSALVNEWLKRLQADFYRGAEAVFGWSFYSQGTKDRTTSTDEFLNWAIAKLGVDLETTSASVKADAIAEAMMQRRVILILDGVEPLQHGPGPQVGELKDFGLRALLRRFAAASPGEAHGLIVVTTRLAIKDIRRWGDRAAPIIHVDRLSDETGRALLRDNGIWGTNRELSAAARDLGGHPLALGLLASFLKETQYGDVRRRDHVRGLLADTENPGVDHAKRVMESYESEWLIHRPVLHSVMQMVGLFDRPASVACLQALRKRPAIAELTDQIVDLDEIDWHRAVSHLRHLRLLSPADPTNRDVLDAHPLIREWFSERLKSRQCGVWRAGHLRLYDHLRSTTREGLTPTLEELSPLYQAIAHGCRTDRHQEALDDIFIRRICRRRGNTGRQIVYYSSRKLGAFSSNLAALSWFFEKPFEKPAANLRHESQSWVLNQAALSLQAQGRVTEALTVQRTALNRPSPLNGGELPQSVLRTCARWNCLLATSGGR